MKLVSKSFPRRLNYESKWVKIVIVNELQLELRERYKDHSSHGLCNLPPHSLASMDTLPGGSFGHYLL